MELIKLNKARQALIEAKSLDEIKGILDTAIAFEAYAKAAKLGIKMQNECAEIKIRAEIKAGEFLSNIPKKQGKRSDKATSPTDGESGKTKTKYIKEAGLNTQTASRWETMASVLEEVREKHIEEMVKKDKELTSASVRKLAEKEKPETPPLPEGVFDVIYADPPWEYEFPVSESRAIENQYPTMSLSELKKMKISFVAENSVLLMWSTAPKLYESLQVMDAWGFNYRSCAIWDKGKMGMGYWFRIQHEILLVGIRGVFSPPTTDNRVRSVFNLHRGKHSEKPALFYKTIESMFPDSKKIELFARGVARDGWSVWGNEAI